MTYFALVRIKYNVTMKAVKGNNASSQPYACKALYYLFDDHAVLIKFD